MSPSPTAPDTAATPGDSLSWADPARAGAFADWLQSIAEPFALLPASVRLAPADAGFRRYLRVDSLADGGCSRIIMDAPPELGSCQSFVHVADLMQQAGLKVPQILQWDAPRGFMLLSDLGPQTLLQAISPIDPVAPPPLAPYLDAVQSLLQWQLASKEGVLPLYDETFVRREMELFPTWYIGAYRQQPIDAAMRKTLDDAFACISANNLSWPRVYMHRDFMPRNLMQQGDGSRLGVLDFQDAVYGPITYDIASLMRDAFVSWDEDFCLDVTIRYWEQARKAGLPVGDDFGEFYRGVEWMGLQRHLKIAGLFARLSLQDGKPQYLADTPRFIHYIRSTCSRYRELRPLGRLVEKIDGIEVPNVFAFGRELNSMPRFFCPTPLTSGELLELPAGAARHVQVLRLQPGDTITLFNTGPGWDGPYPGGEFDATVTRMGRSDVQVQVGTHHTIEREPTQRVMLAVGMPANDRMDWLIEKATEMGVWAIQPLMSERSVLRLSGERAEKKVAHWQSIAISASEQCGGNRVPTVLPVAGLSNWLATLDRDAALPDGTQRLLLSLGAGAQALAAVAQTGTAWCFLSGPEGGLSAAEEAAARAAGFAAVTLGPRILRAETAALFALAGLQNR